MRDRSVDALRALAILGVVLGHWLVTAFVASDGRLHVVSPLAEQPVLTPVSWVLQTLAVFFLVGGFAAARSLKPGQPYLPWLKKRLARFITPVVVLLAAWAVLGTAVPYLKLIISPLWFLAVYAGLTLLTPLVVACYRWLPAVCVAVVAIVDFAGPPWLHWMNLLAGWLVPYTLGVAWARGARLPRAALLIGGVAAAAVLIRWFGYPASMVGVPGDGRSNLNPPTLAAVAFGLAQVGLAMYLRGPLIRLMERPRAWAAVARVNLSAMTIFLWHQTALIAVTTFALGYGRLPGLHTDPDSAWWVLERLAWLPVFAAVLAALVAVFRRFEVIRRI
jgi:hypothetical protein